MTWGRRQLLAATATTLAHPAHATAPDPLDSLRHRWAALHLGTAYDANQEPYASRLTRTGTRAAQHQKSIAPTPTSLWPDHPFDPPAGITAGYGRLLTMAEAYARPRTGLTGDPALLAAVLRGLDHLAATVYHPGTTPYGNWWEWRIGSPRHLLDTVAVLYDHLGAARRDAAFAAVDHFVPDTLLTEYSGISTGANRVDLCRSVALRGILGRVPAKIALARDALSPVFPYVTKGDGLHADGSFVQHTWVAYSGTYGQVLLDGLGRLFTLLDGSPWAVTDPNRQIVLDSVERAFAPLILDGLMMDSVSGRAVSRGHLRDDDLGVLRSDHFHGQALIAAIPLLMTVASPAERTRWTARAKGWIERSAAPGSPSPILTAPQFDVADLARLHALADAHVPAAPEPVGHTLFPGMDRAVHRRPGWTANLAMASERIASYECGNGENPRGWHTGAGMLYWWTPGSDESDKGHRPDAARRLNDQYTDWFWPTVDPYRLPGTTVSTRRLPDRAGGEWGAPRPAVRWVGGSTDGEFASVGQHLKGLGSTLEAHTSWIFAADAVVCLGAAITSTDGVPVETVVDNRNLGEAGTASGRHSFTLDPAPRPRWAHLTGHGGWVFPGGAAPGTLRTLEEARTGSWHDINTTSTTERRTRRYRTLWLDHGTDPVAASYLYLLMPGASRRTVAARAADPHWLALLAHTGDVHAVAVRSLGLTAANFWRAGTAGPLTVTAPASVLVRERGRTATIHLSEPVRSGRPVEVVWDRPVRRVVAADPSVEVLAAGRSVRLRITPGTRGGSHRCEVTLRGEP
ncbi:polysaccharide lyase 8 family protein [Streptomyces sp. SID3212]|uniref:polysaccharide lyase 8 family protein n=1 Tax=Streptomyces sp. SID3212 TaxID=2690259 RepID=UPI00136E15D2|nr:polysaccharide lyase 8 family protein [Streptomyces sp. SID3212]MYV55108.1 lyase [Streptomyces sp. SID3212]